MAHTFSSTFWTVELKNLIEDKFKWDTKLGIEYNLSFMPKTNTPSYVPNFWRGDESGPEYHLLNSISLRYVLQRLQSVMGFRLSKGWLQAFDGINKNFRDFENPVNVKLIRKVR